MKKYLIWLLFTAALFAQVENPPSGNGVGVYVVASLPVAPVTGTVAVVTDGNSATDCTVGLGSTLVLCRFDGAAWGTFPAGSASAGGSNTQLQYNSANALAGAAQWTTNGTTITAGASGVLNLASSPVLTGLVLPKGAGAAPIIEGQSAFNTTTHLPVWGFNGASTTTIPTTLANASHKWLNSYDQTTGAFTQTQPAISDLTATISLPLSLSTNTLSCPTCVVSTTPGAGVAHFAGSTQTVTSSAVVAADTDTSIAHTGVDVNTSYQVTATHLASPLPLLQGGTAVAAASAAAAFNALAPSTATGGIILATGVNTYGNLAIGTNGQCLTSNGTTAVWGACASGSVGAGGGLTSNAIPKATAGFTLADSLLTDNATTLAYSGTGGFTLSGANSFLKVTEGTAPTGSASGNDWLYGDSTAHRLKVKNNSNTADTLALFSDNLSVFAATTSAQFFGVISDESGSGAVTGATSPAFTTDIHCVSAGGCTLGTAALPPSSIYIGGSATNNIRLTGTSAAARVVTIPDVGTDTGATVVLSPTSTTTTFVLHATATAGLYTPSAIAAGDLPTVTIAKGGLNTTTATAGQVPNSSSASASSWTSTITLGASGTPGSITMGNATSGTVLLQTVTGALGSVTISLPAATGTVAVSATSPITESAAGAIGCATCVVASAPGAGLAHFAGSTQTVTSSAVVDADLSGQVGISHGGTGQATKQAAFDALSPLSATGDLVYFDGSHNVAFPRGTANQCLTTNSGGTTIAWGACSTGSVTAANMSNGQLVAATGASGITSYSINTPATLDSGGNITATSFTSSSTGAGIFYLGQGTSQALGTNSIGFMAPTSVTSYNFVFPSAASSGFLKFTNSSGVVTGVFDAAINQASDITGVTPTTNGGTGLSAPNTHSLLVGAGSPAALTTLSVGSTGTVLIGNSSADPSFSYTPVFGAVGHQGSVGIAGTTSGVVTLAVQAVATTYNFNLPAGAGNIGDCLKSGGGGSSPMTWASCGGGGSTAWDTLTAPTTSNLTLSMGLFTTAITYGDQGASAAIPLFTVTDAASTSSDRSLNLVTDTGGSSNHISFSARYRGSDTIKVCPAVGSVTGVAVVGAIIACETVNSVNATPIAKFLVESATNAHTTARFYQNGAAQTGNGVEIFTKTAAGTGFNSLLVKTGCTDGDTTCAAGTVQFTIRGDGLTTVNNTVSATTFTSTVSTGTAPFTVSSTTNVANLNASSLSGATFAAPGAIGGGTPGSGAFTTLTGTSSITLGANGGTGGSVVLNGSTSGSATINTSATGVLALPSGTTATNMALTTPSLGAATATTINLVTITQPAASATLTIANTKTLTATNTMDVSKTAGVAGAIPWYDTTTSQSASALLGQYGTMYGGGASAAPATLTAPSTNGQYFVGYTVTGSAALAPTALLSTSMPAGFAIGSLDTGTPKFTFSANTITVTGALTATNAALTTPSIGAATGTSLYATGIIDGKATVNVSTTTPCTLGTASANCSAANSLSGYTVNEHATAGTAIVYNLPTAAAGLQYCVANGYNGSAANTGTLELLTSATGQFIIYTDGTLSATHGNVTSTGAAGDAACVVGVDATHWMLYVNRGSWTKN